MVLITAIWQKLVWCGLVGGVAGLVFGVASLFQRTASQSYQTSLLGLAFDTLAGTLLGLVLLGVPASVWVLGKWAFHGGRQVELTTDAGKGAMVGSTAAVPGTIVGAAGGLFLGAIVLGCIHFLSAILGAPWFESISKHLVTWYIVAATVGGLIGFLAGTFLGSAVGAIWGGARSMSRH